MENIHKIKMAYKEKLNTLFKEVVKPINHKLIREVQDVDLVFDYPTQNSVKELSSFILNFMNKYNIGTLVKPTHWGIRGYNEIRQTLYDSIKQQMTKQKPVGAFQLFDDLKDDVTGKLTKNYTSYDYARVARTEGKRVTTLYQLEKLKEAGVEKVKHRTRGDNKVSSICKLHNGRIDKIDWLLSPQGEASRPPRHPQCRCRIQPVI